MEKEYLWMLMKCRLGSGRVEGWVGFPGKMDELG